MDSYSILVRWSLVYETSIISQSYTFLKTNLIKTMSRQCLTLTIILDWIQPADQTPPIQSDKCQCRIDAAVFSWWWAHACPKHVEKRNKYIKQNYAPGWIYLQDRDTISHCMCKHKMTLSGSTDEGRFSVSLSLSRQPAVEVLLYHAVSVLLIVRGKYC